jgi:PKHD-type hydroxylase
VSARDIKHAAFQFLPMTASRAVGFWCCEEAFTQEECDRIDAMARALNFERAGVKGEGDEMRESEGRSSFVSWIGYSPDTEWLYTRLAHHVQYANQMIGGFQLWGFAEALQYSVYPPGVGFDWHSDHGSTPDEPPRPPRKVSFTLQLSREGDYEGGDFEVMRHAASRRRGDMVVFPAFASHRVAPITSGERVSLAGWVCGDEFK